MLVRRHPTLPELEARHCRIPQVEWTYNSTGDDRFRRVCVLREKRAKDAGLSCERPQQLIGAETKRTDFALAA